MTLDRKAIRRDALLEAAAIAEDHPITAPLWAVRPGEAIAATLRAKADEWTGEPEPRDAWPYAVAGLIVVAFFAAVLGLAWVLAGGLV